MAQLLVARLLHERLDFGVAQFGLGLALELRLGNLDRDHRCQPLTDIVTGEVGLLLLEELPVLGVLVDHAGQRRPETLLVGAALVGVDGVGEGVHRLGVAGVPLHGDLDLVAHAFSGEIHHTLVDRLFGAVDVFDEVHQPAGVVEGAVFDLLLRCGLLGGFLLGRLRCRCGIADHLIDDLGRGDPLIGQGDGQGLVEEGHLLKPAGHRLEVVVRGLKDSRIRPEPDGGTGLLAGLALFERPWHGVVVALEPLVSVPADIGFQAGGQRVDHRDADPVQTTRDLIGALFELSAGMQDGHHDVDGRNTGLVHLDRDTPAVVGDLHPAVLENPHVDLVRVAGHGLVHGIVDDLPDQVV